jgi:hypothetical protein
MIEFKGGRLPHDPAKPKLMLADHLTELPGAAPAFADYLSHVPSWPMYGNDTCGDCVAPETRVLTESLEWVRAGSLLPGDRLLAFDEESQVKNGYKRGRWLRPTTVERADIVTRPCYELEFEDGTVVRSSAGHRWLTRSTVQGRLGCQEWERTEDLRAEDPRRTCIIKPLDVWDTDTSWDAGYLAGAFDGEGHLEQLARANRVAFSQTANAMLDQVELSLKEVGFDYTHEVNNRHKVLRVDGSPRKDMHVLRIGSRREFLRFMGSIRPRRLLAKYDAVLGRLPGDRVALVRKTYIGEQPVVMLDTSSRTYFAEGLASHNCTIATVGHALQATSLYGAGTEVRLPDDAILSKYEALSGYVPGDDSTDTGLVVQDVLNDWRKNGIEGHKALAFAGIDPDDFDTVRQAIDLFGWVYLGITVTQSAMNQANSRQPWDVVPNPGPVLGGHAIPAGSYDQTAASEFMVVTWGQLQAMTKAFWSKYVDECWAVILPEWVNAVGATPTGLDLYSLGEDFASLTGEPNPFPAPAPPPPPPDPDPEPTPDPVPPAPAPSPVPPDIADRDLAEVLHEWLDGHHHVFYHGVQEACREWLAARGL